MEIEGDRNLLLDPLSVQYAVEETALGRWRRHVSPNGQTFSEYISHATFFGLPMVHFVRGRDPATLRGVTARGVIAIGRKAVGVFAVGQASFGLVAVGQAAFGILLGIGQAATGLVCVGQLAVGYAALGQLAIGHTVVGQFAVGIYGLGQFALAVHRWDTQHVDPVAEQFFRQLWPY